MRKSISYEIDNAKKLSIVKQFFVDILQKGQTA